MVLAAYTVQWSDFSPFAVEDGDQNTVGLSGPLPGGDHVGLAMVHDPTRVAAGSVIVTLTAGKYIWRYKEIKALDLNNNPVGSISTVWWRRGPVVMTLSAAEVRSLVFVKTDQFFNVRHIDEYVASGVSSYGGWRLTFNWAQD